MADSKITDYAATTSVADADQIEVVQGGVNKRTAFSQILTYIQAGISAALAAKADATALTAHTGNTSNPHSTTKAQVGLGNVDNTADASKPVSTATQTALDAKLAIANNLSDLNNKATARANLGIEGRTTFSNADYTALATDKYVAQIGTLSAPRTVTLPAASAVPAGYVLTIADESGSLTSANTLIIARAGTDTINGATSYTTNAPYAQIAFRSNGSNGWTYDIQGIGRGGTGATTAAAARTNLQTAFIRQNHAGGSICEPFLNGLSTSSATPTGALGFVTTVSGTAAAVAALVPPDATSFGAMSCTTGTTTTGRAGIVSSISNIRFGGIALRSEIRFQFPTALLDGTESGAFYLGFVDSVSAAPTDGVYLYWDNTQTNFRYRTRNNSTQTDVDSGLAPAINTWYIVSIAVDAAGANAIFTIDGANSQTITTNIPTASGRETGLVGNMIKSAGTTARLWYVDDWALSWGTAA